MSTFENPNFSCVSHPVHFSFGSHEDFATSFFPFSDVRSDFNTWFEWKTQNAKSVCLVFGAVCFIVSELCLPGCVFEGLAGQRRTTFVGSN